MFGSFVVRLSFLALSALLVTACIEREGGPKAPSVTALDHETHTAFPVAKGVHALADCNSCHGDFDTFKEFTCVGCHEHSQERTDPTHVRAANYTWSGTRCYECHPDGKATAVDHASLFPIGSGTLHDNISCSTCHVDPLNRKVVDCIGCHTHAATETGQIHNGIPGYAWTSPKCLECHPQGKITGVEHTFFPIASGTSHDNISCSTCHPDRTNRKVVDCVTCHTAPSTDPEHSRVGGYARDSGLCVRCHGDSQVHPVSSHLPFSILLETKHYRTSCLVCHPASRADKPWAQDFTPFDCLSCHPKGAMDDKHQSFSTYRYVSATCVSSGCHQNGRKP